MASKAAQDSTAQPHSRDRILGAAAKLFRRQGYAATNLREIATASGLKAGSLYNHFSSKEEIVTELLNRGTETVFERVNAAVDAQPPSSPASQRLRAGIEAHLSCLLGDDDFTSANIRIFAHVPAHVRDAALPSRHAYERYWLELLSECRAAGDEPPTDVQLLSMFLFGAMNWTIEWYKPRRDDIGEMADQLTRIFMPRM